MQSEVTFKKPVVFYARPLDRNQFLNLQREGRGMWAWRVVDVMGDGDARQDGRREFSRESVLFLVSSALGPLQDLW